MTLSNRTVRILVSLLAIPIIVFITLYGKLAFLGFALLIGLISYFEFDKLAHHKNADGNLLLGLISVLAILLNAYFNFIEFEMLLMIIIPAFLLTNLFRENKSIIANTGATLIGVFYIGLFSGSFIMIREFFPAANYIYGGYLIISILVSIWVCDSAAYFIGSAYGKHKLFPVVSPNKSWEGAIAGFIFALISMIMLKIILVGFLNWIDAIVIGIIIGTLGQIGDLVESLFKRDAGVKDSSSLIPGHGGIFDRFDSFLFTSPIIYLYLHFFISK